MEFLQLHCGVKCCGWEAQLRVRVVVKADYRYIPVVKELKLFPRARLYATVNEKIGDIVSINSFSITDIEI